MTKASRTGAEELGSLGATDGGLEDVQGHLPVTPAQRTARHLRKVHRDPVFHEGHVQNNPLARRAVGPLEISATTGPTRQGQLAFALRTWLSHQYVSHRLVALCRFGRLPRLDRPSVVHASSVSRFEPGGASEQLVASHPRVLQGVSWACVWTT